MAENSGLTDNIQKLFEKTFKEFQKKHCSINTKITLELMRKPFKDLHFLSYDVEENIFFILLKTEIENLEHHPKELIQVDIQSLSVELKVRNLKDSNYYFEVHGFSKEIDVGKSYFEVKGGKISFCLMKKKPEKWESLLYHDPKVIAKYEETLKEQIASNPVLKRKEHIMNLWNIERISMLRMDLARILTGLNIPDFNFSRKVTTEEVFEYLKLNLSDFSTDEEFSLFAYVIYLQEKTKFEKLDEKYMGKKLKGRKKNNTRNKEAENLKNKGNGYFKLKKFIEALDCFSQAIKLDPKCAAYYSNRSVVHFHFGQFVPCITDALEALAIDPFYSTPWLYLGKSFRYMMIIDTSIICLQRAKTLDEVNLSLDKELNDAYILLENIVVYINSVKLGNNSEKETCIKHITTITRKDSGIENLNPKELKFDKLIDMLNFRRVIGQLIKLLCSQGMISHAKVEARYLINHGSFTYVNDTFINYLLGICYYFEDNEKEVLANFKKFLEMKMPDSLLNKGEVSYCNYIEAIYSARRKGNDYFDNGQFDDAIKCYLKEIDNLEIIMIIRSNLFYKIACAKVHLHKENEALTYLNLAIDECHNNHEAFAARGEYYLRQKTFKDALDNFEQANKFHPCDRYVELIHVARFKQSSPLCDDENLLKEKSLQKSLAYCKKEIGNKHFNNKCFDDAISVYTEAIDLDPFNPVYYSNRAACHIILKDFIKGQKDCEEALKIDSSFVKGLYRLSKCYIALGKPEKAITVLVKALIINPKEGNLLEGKIIAECLKKTSIDGDNEYNAKKYETAEQYFSEAIEKAEACVELRLKKIDCLIHLEKFDEALAETDLVVPFDRDNSNLYYYMGICHFHKQEHDKSIECIKKSLTLKSDNKRASNFLMSVENVLRSKELGDKAYEANKFKEALSYYEKGLKQDVINKTLTLVFHLNIGKIHMKENNIEESINHFSSIINIQTENYEAYKHRAECYLRLNLLEKALRDFEELYKFAPTKEHEILVCEAKAKLEVFSKFTSEEELKRALSVCKQERAEKFFKNKIYEAALKCYTEAIHLNSDNYSLYISRASCFIAMKKYPSALVDAKEVIERDNNCVQAFLIIGYCHTILGNAKEAISSFEQAAKLDAVNIEICAGIQKALKLKQCLDNAENALRNGRIDRAYDMYKCASRTAVGCSSLLLNIAECLISLQRLPALSKLIESVSDMLRESSEYLCIKGLDYYHKDKMSDSIKYLERAVEVDSSNKKCNEHLHKIRLVYDKKKKGNCAFFQLKYDEALNYYKEGLNIETDNLLIQSKLHFNIGVVLKKQNMIADAINRFTRAISIQDSYIKALEKRAECFKKINDLENAIKDYNRLYVITNSKKYFELKEDIEKLLNKNSSKKDFYKILKISRDASMDEIRKSYKTLAKEFHPDRLRTEIDKEIGEEKFKEINEAYTVLSDPFKREKYDRNETYDRDIPFEFPFHPFMFNPFARAAFYRFQENIYDPF